MIYINLKDKEDYHPSKFFEQPTIFRPSMYVILVVIPEEQKMLMAKQINRYHLSNATWIIVTPKECRDLCEKYDFFYELVVMQITMTGNKDDIFFSPHNWEMLQITHEPKEDPFDQQFVDVINRLLDQVLYNFPQESRQYKKRITELLLDLISSGVFQMQVDHKKVLGN
jgi:hypothetical protein